LLAHDCILSKIAVSGNTGAVQSDKNEAFVFGLEIEENERGKGYGKDTMRLIEEVLKNKAISSIRLHVYDSSKIAVNLYNNIGFETVSRIMRKTIKS
jgi:ribosomal protein S18 acetylase RimI-like enzyme